MHLSESESTRAREVYQDLSGLREDVELVLRGLNLAVVYVPGKRYDSLGFSRFHGALNRLRYVVTEDELE